MKKFTYFPRMFRLEIDPMLANYLVLAQMPLKWVDLEAELGW